LTVLKNPKKYDLQVKIFECGIFYTPARERTGKWEISAISLFVRETPAQNGRVGRYEGDILIMDKLIWCAEKLYSITDQHFLG
jgi:hypothetical protein